MMTCRNNNGFTLIELMIAMAITAAVLAGTYRVYTQGVRVNNNQRAVVNMQQNLRAAVYYIERELKTAGLDPSGNAQGAGISVAESSRVMVGADIGGGDPTDPNAFFDGAISANEQVTYKIDNDTAENAGIGDGICDSLQGHNANPCNLVRVTGGNPGATGDTIAENIDALNFVYLGVDSTDPTCDNNCYLMTPNDTLDDIRSIQFTIVARSGLPQPGFSVPFSENRVFYNQWPDRAIILPNLLTNDGFRRILLTSEINCRNMGF